MNMLGHTKLTFFDAYILRKTKILPNSNQNIINQPSTTTTTNIIR